MKTAGNNENTRDASFSGNPCIERTKICSQKMNFKQQLTIVLLKRLQYGTSIVKIIVYFRRTCYTQNVGYIKKYLYYYENGELIISLNTQ